MITFERIDINNNSYPDKNQIGEYNIFQTTAWLNYIAEVQHGEPIVAVIRKDEHFLGYFTGIIFHKFGFKILGSPFRGALTYFMGFNLLPGAPKKEILQALQIFAFKDLDCHYLEVIDPCLGPGDWKGLHFNVEYLHYYGIDLSKSEDELLNNMEYSARKAIRKSVKNRVVIEVTSDINIADEYYAQYNDVMQKHSLYPTYSLNSVKKLVEYMLPTGKIHLLRAKNSDGTCIATGIFLEENKIAVAWGIMSLRQYQHLRPNEPLYWYGIRSMKNLGIQILNLGGKNERFKEKLGASELPLYRIMKMKYRIFELFFYPIMSLRVDWLRNYFLKRLI